MRPAGKGLSTDEEIFSHRYDIKSNVIYYYFRNELTAELLTNLSGYSMMARRGANYTEFIALNKFHGVMVSTSNVLLKVKSFCNCMLL